MSIAAISLMSDRALVAVDSACEVFGEPEHVEAPKLHLITLAGVALIGLGQSEVTQLAFHKLQKPGCGVDFDLIAESMRSILERAREVVGVDSRVNAKPSPDWFGGNLAYLVGWSRRSGRMRARAYLNTPGAMHFTEHEIPRWTVHPRDFSAEISAPSNLEEMEAFARDAVRYGKSVAPRYPYGGRFVLAELRRDSIQTITKDA